MLVTNLYSYIVSTVKYTIQLNVHHLLYNCFLFFILQRCQEEQEIKLKSLTANIKIAQEAKKAPIKQTKMAYVDCVVKPPRNIAKKQVSYIIYKTRNLNIILV